LVCPRQHDGAVFCASLADDLDPLGAVEDEPDARADDSVIVDEHHARVHGRTLARRPARAIIGP
jgi:hypothetical protein